jgi:hypothetical protein
MFTKTRHFAATTVSTMYTDGALDREVIQVHMEGWFAVSDQVAPTPQVMASDQTSTAFLVPAS